MRLRVALLLAASCVPSFAQMSMSVHELTLFMESVHKEKQNDREVYAFLRKVKLTERLDDATLETLRSNATGPKSAEALKALRDASASLPVPPQTPVPAPTETAKPGAVQIPAPDSEQQGKIIEEARMQALDYTKHLPNFICNQFTKRYYDMNATGHWRLADTVNARVTFFEQKEDYKLMTVNNQPVFMGLEQLGGTVSTGEFGTLLKELFSPESQAQFEWERWGTIRGQRCYVFHYRILQQNSKWHIVAQRTQEYVPGYQGLVYIEKDTNSVVRITQEAEGLPAGFPIQDVKLMLDYKFQKVGEQEFLLPLSATNQARQSRYLTKNDVDFRLYRRYGTETTITYDMQAEKEENSAEGKAEKGKEPPK